MEAIEFRGEFFVARSVICPAWRTFWRTVLYMHSPFSVSLTRAHLVPCLRQNCRRQVEIEIMQDLRDGTGLSLSNCHFHSVSDGTSCLVSWCCTAPRSAVLGSRSLSFSICHPVEACGIHNVLLQPGFGFCGVITLNPDSHPFLPLRRLHPPTFLLIFLTESFS